MLGPGPDRADGPGDLDDGPGEFDVDVGPYVLAQPEGPGEYDDLWPVTAFIFRGGGKPSAKHGVGAPKLPVKHVVLASKFTHGALLRAATPGDRDDDDGPAYVRAFSPLAAGPGEREDGLPTTPEPAATNGGLTGLDGGVGPRDVAPCVRAGETLWPRLPDPVKMSVASLEKSSWSAINSLQPGSALKPFCNSRRASAERPMRHKALTSRNHPFMKSGFNLVQCCASSRDRAQSSTAE